MHSPLLPRPGLRRLLLPALAVALAFSLAGCVGMWGQRRHHESSSVVQFLYPDQDLPFVQPAIPTLRLPLRIGVAFVPAGLSGGRGFSHIQANFTELQKTELMRKVSAQFKTLPFVQSIEIIPATYLRPGGGFTNLDQLRTMLGIDVIALIAYDQAQSSDDTEASLAYWTIVGSYVVPGQRNSTHTLMEAAVYDIPSRSLLFRAPGTSTIQNHATLVRNAHELKKSSAAGIEQASAQMTAALAQELELFKVRAREEPATVKIEHKPGYTGGGSLDAGFSLVLLVLLGTAGVRAVQGKHPHARK
ncbi:rhombotarget lipoprotein [Lacunisphaera limnophila]|nr:rhombotarget lipoprotein [Lacunisphaera limnophila]